MNGEIIFTLKDIGMFVLWLLLCGILVYIILLLKNLYSSLKVVKGIIKNNEESINKVLDESPGISKNINDISKEVAYDLSVFKGTIDNIAETSESVTGVIKDNNTVVDSMSSVLHTATMAKKAVDKFLAKDE
ncbi:hypothetical protein [Helicovermis profundi]|uniref:DUF948 domain-containing protein n=1 Tax=Helicovermis profundi TaxID=3065157 RepID=A0AAU9E553_9FIRM|nr:hypothetical protein HLPR_00280 [Clostridia bacterium S502]